MRSQRAAMPGARGGVPGVGAGWVPGGLYRVPTQTIPGPIFSHISGLRAYLRPNEGNLRYIYEVSEIGSRIDQN